MRGTESIAFANNQTHATYGMPTGAGLSQGLAGGRYLMTISCTGTPTVAVQVEDFAGNFVTVDPIVVSLASGGGSAIYDLPPGYVQVVIGTSTANYCALTRVPLE